MEPTTEPTVGPTAEPTVGPTAEPSSIPTAEPSSIPTAEPSSIPTAEPSSTPTAEPTVSPTVNPTAEPTVNPTVEPTIAPTEGASKKPTVRPTHVSTCMPSYVPTNKPTLAPSDLPTDIPTDTPTDHPTWKPSGVPSKKPSGKPSGMPSKKSSASPSLWPTIKTAATLTYESSLKISGVVSCSALGSSSQLSISQAQAIIAGISASNVRYLSCNDNSGRRLFNLFSAFSNSANKKVQKKIITQTVNVTTETTILVPGGAADAAALYNATTSKLAIGVKSGAFTTALQSASVTNGATATLLASVTGIASEQPMIFQATLTPTGRPSTKPSRIPTSAPSCKPPLPICQYASYCKTDSDCYAGNYCRLDQMPYYSQCLPNPSSYKSSDCIPNYYGSNQPCTKTSDCCDPGAYCNSKSFRQCQQPVAGSALCSVPTGFSTSFCAPTLKTTTSPTGKPIANPVTTPVSKPTMTPITPSTKPISSPISPATLICQYGGYCRNDADCVAGNKCNIQSQYYSQCIPNPSSYKISDCVAPYGSCTSQSPCCDPGAYCTPYKQCAQPNGNGMCFYPGGYPTAPVAKPVSKPTFTPTIRPSGKPMAPSTKPISLTNKPTTSKPSSKPVNPTLMPIPPSFKPVPSPTFNPNQICQYSGYCRNDADCVAGNKCNIQSQYYSQCIPNPSSYKTSDCVAPYGSCTSQSTCCDPGAYCTPYKQCTQPIAGSGMCLSPGGYAVMPVSSPSIMPVPPSNKPVNPSAMPISPSSKPVNPTLMPILPSFKPVPSPTFNPNQICQYSGYCRNDADCVAGNKCNIQSQYYSQCIPNPSSYKTSDCVAPYGSCTSHLTCCDPGAYCTPYKQCTQPIAGSGMCLSPGSYAVMPVSSPSSMPISPSNMPLAQTGMPLLPTGKPVASPSGMPVNNKKLICQYGGFCKVNSDCVAGNKCNVQSQYYSQCVPDQSSYMITNCVASWGQCNANSKCCDPGAKCSNNQCTQPVSSSGACVSPSGY